MHRKPSNRLKAPISKAFQDIKGKFKDIAVSFLVAGFVIIVPSFKVHSEKAMNSSLTLISREDYASRYQGAALRAHGATVTNPKDEKLKTAYNNRIVTAYSSTPEETDETPFITASGNQVRFGIAAANWLPIGTEVRIPEYFGDQVFKVEDRMNEKHGDRLDIWMPSKDEALEFGRRITKIEVLL